MADGVRIEIAARGNAAKAISGGMLESKLFLSMDEIVSAVESAATPGLMALRQNVNGIRRVTGRLSAAPAITTRIYRRRKTGLVGVALVGYRAGVAPHASLIEYGTKNRTSRRGNRGAVAAQWPLRRAFDQTRSVMQAKLSAELQRVLASKAASVGQ